MLDIRQYRSSDGPDVWALNGLPFRGATADSSVPLRLKPATVPPKEFPDLANVDQTFIGAGGDFFVAELDSHIVGMAGFRANEQGQAQVLRVRVHPATRRQHVGWQLMKTVEVRARQLGFMEAFLDTSTDQPEAMAFYSALGYEQVGQETRPEWNWTLAYFRKRLV